MELSNLENGNAVAVFTSGGDSPGMNAVVRSVVRMSEFYGRKPYVIMEGYRGLIEGGEYIREFKWEDTSMIIHKGGTVAGSARSAEFRERAGRLKACRHLVERNITNLVCCGGDGSLTGANIFKLEWASLVQELLTKGEITEDQAARCSYLNLVGCCGSIDNDLVSDASLTIGADTALHRIVDAIDAVQSTASSHQRTFVLEIMGRACGWLAWAAGMATGADFVFIPEAPPKYADWEQVLCDTLDRRRKRGARLCTVLVAEGAIDVKGQPIKTEYVRQVIVDRIKHDTRATILGHVQRGGHASCYDRILGTICGSMCVEKIRRVHPGDPATICGVKGFFPVFNELVETVAATQEVGKYTAALDFENAILARKNDFKRKFAYHKAINRDIAKVEEGSNEKNVLILCSGAPAGGMNAAIRSGTHYARNYGYNVFCARDGFEGLLNGKVEPLEWMQVADWQTDGGCNIGSDRKTPTDIQGIKDALVKHEIHALLVIGGFDALQGVYNLRDHVPVPVAFIPATISNNVPGTDFSIGSDTSCNAIVASLDVCKKSAAATNNRVFIVETQGRMCGYLATISGIAGGADVVYTREEGVTLNQLVRDIARFKRMITTHHKRHFIVVRNEFCSERYDLDFMERLFAEEGKGIFTVRTVKLGHLCQGDYPSPLDRVRASLWAATGVRFLIDSLKEKTSRKMVVGLVNARVQVLPVDTAWNNAAPGNRIPKERKWQWMLVLQQYLSCYKTTPHDDEYRSLIDKLTTDHHMVLNSARVSFDLGTYEESKI